MSQPTAEDRMGNVAKGCVGLIAAGVLLLLALAAFAFWHHEQKVPHAAPAPSAERLKLLKSG